MAENRKEKGADKRRENQARVAKLPGVENAGGGQRAGNGNPAQNARTLPAAAPAGNAKEAAQALAHLAAEKAARELAAQGLAAPVIGKEEIRNAREILQKYKRGKANLEARVVANEEWYKMRHWEQIRHNRRESDPRPASAWLFNSIANKHADAMDNFPEPNVLPREAQDVPEAKALSAILPVILEQNQFEQTYSDVWWYKLKSGTGVYGVFWNAQKHNGLGDIDIRQLDLLNLFWQPGIKDLQDSRHLFSVSLVDNEVLKEQYPHLKNLGGNAVEVARYRYDDAVDTSDKTAVVDWYYKKLENGRTLLHYCKFCNDEVLYASENDPLYFGRGFYDHGKYPVVFDVLFVEEGSPAGFGMVDVMKDVQMYIDRLNQLIVKNAMMASKKRFFIRDDGSINEKEFADWENDFIHVSGGGLGEDSIRELITQPVPGLFVNLMQMKIDELKETSGNRDFSQGGVTGGVTAASAISALQEAGSKLSRDMVKSAYRAFAQINYLCLELIRQFYDEPRCFRILGSGGEPTFTTFDNGALRPQEQGAPFGVQSGLRVPEFDIQITSQRSSPFTKISQNELAKELYSMGFFNPPMADQAMACLDMMEFEGKELVLRQIGRNSTLERRLAETQERLEKMALIIDKDHGAGLSQLVAGTGEGN